ncbi:prepilin-type N-terminal cleavage/methylation domain-containing protein [Shigella sonnei]|nr:prepilin-type N-terminal cleavage/methylation domain-containing protein [Shigella sonnei]EHV2518023.1 prepilin-type N-terminal cleavage/methylation domain-containing protein [Escherichia coli]
MNKHNKEGFSLLELLLVLGIVSALIISAFIIYPKVQTMYRVDKIAKLF